MLDSICILCYIKEIQGGDASITLHARPSACDAIANGYGTVGTKRLFHEYVPCYRSFISINNSIINIFTGVLGEFLHYKH